MIPNRAMFPIGLAVALLFAPPAAIRQGPDLVSAFIAAVNSKDKEKLRSYIESYWDNAMKPEQRVERFWPIVEQGTPFKLIKVVDQSPKMVRALIEDKTGERLALTFELFGDPPKIGRLLLISPESLDALPPKDYTGWKSLESLARSVRKDTESPAIAIAVWRDGQPIEIAVDGVRKLGSSESVTKDDVWHVGSIGKSFTSTLICCLIDMGKLRWDMTLKEAFPNVPMKPGYEKVTLEQIMHHRGGIPQDMGFSALQVQMICGKETAPEKIRANYAKDIFSRDPIGKPGEKFAYSNAGYALLGHLAERVMKKPYESLMKELVFGPLGMKSAAIGESSIPAKRPSGHVPEDNGLKPHNLGGKLGMLIAPAGDAWCSIGDLATFCKMHLDGLRGKNGLLKATTIKRLHDPVAENAGGPGYACGWSVGPLPGTSTRHGHNGSNGTFRAEMALWVKEGLVAVSVVNRGGEAEPSPPLQAVMAIAKRFSPEGN